MATIVETSKCEADELVLLLNHCLPPDLAKLWHTTADMLLMLRAGGITSYTTSRRIGILLRNQKLMDLNRNRTNNMYHYCFNEKGKEYDDPIQQRVAFREKERPQIETNYFTKLGITFKFIKTVTSQQTANNATTSAANKTATSRATNNNKSVNKNNNMNSVSDNNNKTTGATTNNNKNNNSTPKKRSTSSTPSIATETGYMIAHLGIVEEVQAANVEHRKTCKSILLVHDKRRFGFEVFTDLGCKFCKKTYTIRSGPKPTEAPKTNTPQQQQQQKKKRGRKASPLNMTMTNGMHASAITIAQMQGLCGEVGIVSPSETGQHNMMRTRKDAIKVVAEEVLKENRKEHVRMCKETNPENTIKHKDKDGKEHNICYGPVSADGAGEKRAYNHIINGSQHCTVVFSLVTSKVIAVKHDQISCAKCAQRVTHLVTVDKKRAEDITEEDLKHDGQCYINSKHGPAVAEEYALESIAEYLLIDPVTKKLRPDDEAILVDWLVADGDTKGAIRFIKKQASIIQEFDGVAIYMPDIGHFIKCISNGLFKLSSQHSELRGVSLLEASRIKSICADITGILKDYGKERKQIQEGNKDDAVAMQQKLKVCRDGAISRINAIVPHHCNDHSKCCSVKDCYVIKRRRHYIILHKSMNPTCERSQEEIVKRHAADISKDHAANGRFKGKHMSMGARSQGKVMEVITKRLDVKNIDRVSEGNSSNRCENMFSVLAKFTHGKRNYQGRTDSWECNILYVAITINHDDAREIENKIRALTGVEESPSLREKATATAAGRKKYQQQHKKEDHVKHRRSVSKIASTQRAVKNTTAPARHKPNKLSPKDECKSDSKKKPAKSAPKKKRKKCSNCQTFHEGDCAEATNGDGASAKKNKKQKKGEFTGDDLALFLLSKK